MESRQLLPQRQVFPVQLIFQRTKLRLGTLSILDVGVDPVPFDDLSSLIAQRVHVAGGDG